MKSLILILAAAALFAVPVTYAGVDELQSSAENGTLTDQPASRSILFIETERNAEADMATDENYGGLVLPGSPLPMSRSSIELDRMLSLDFSVDDETGAVSSSSPDRTKLNPGKAILLSALLPGAGEFYIAQNTYDSKIQYLKSAVFFALEAGFWYGAVSYAMRGQDREDQYELYADQNWNEGIYRGYEFYLAKQAPEGDYPIPPGELEITDWNNLTWNEKIDYLPDNFTHELPEEKDQQYYEMIGKYLSQFGIGWDGEYETYNPDNPDEFYTGFTWDGLNRYANRYADMRYDSNQLLDTSAMYFMLIMVNHVGSALDAGFTVRLRNQKIADADLGMRITRFNGQNVALGNLKITF